MGATVCRRRCLWPSTSTAGATSGRCGPLRAVSVRPVFHAVRIWNAAGSRDRQEPPHEAYSKIWWVYWRAKAALRRRINTKPTMPRPNSAMLPGSGTALFAPVCFVPHGPLSQSATGLVPGSPPPPPATGLPAESGGGIKSEARMPLTSSSSKASSTGFSPLLCLGCWPLVA